MCWSVAGFLPETGWRLEWKRFGFGGLREGEFFGVKIQVLIRALSFEGAFLWLQDCICHCVEVTHADDDGNERCAGTVSGSDQPADAVDGQQCGQCGYAGVQDAGVRL